MKLDAIARAVKEKPTLKFFRVGTNAILQFNPAGFISYATGAEFRPTVDDLIADYEIDCKHPLDRILTLGDYAVSGGLCKECGRQVQLKGSDPLPVIPEAPVAVDDWKPFRPEELASKRKEVAAQAAKAQEELRAEKKSLFGNKKPTKK